MVARSTRSRLAKNSFSGWSPTLRTVSGTSAGAAIDSVDKSPTTRAREAVRMIKVVPK